MASEHTQAVEGRFALARRIGTLNPLPVFAAGLFLGAFLLFCIEPMFVKMLLPLLGGSPAVWNTATVFFQAMLLCGYCYVHVTTRYLGMRRQAILHSVLLILSLATLPIAVATGWDPPVAHTPVFWLIGLLTISMGVPFFLLSATAPLLQSWFAQTDHTEARDPYFLYGASNLGSLLALLSYPAVIEPHLTLGQQSQIWAWGYGGLLALIVLCMTLVISSQFLRADEPVASTDTDVTSSVNWAGRLHWIALAFVPSSLLLGVTSYIVTDLFSAPLLWVIPLALYLVTFIVAFARRPWIKASWMARVLPYLFIPIAITFAWPSSTWLFLPLHLAAFFVASMICHGELARRRPAAGDLTGFYLCMSLGGVLGGLFNAIVAPLLFNSIYEYPIAIVLACLLVPKRDQAGHLSRIDWKDLALPAALLAIMFVPMLAKETIGRVGVDLFCAFAGIAVFSFSERPVRFALGILVLLISASASTLTGQTLTRERSFFGVHKVVSQQDGRVIALMHGTTFHGAEYTAPEHWRDTIMYYSPAGPIGQFFAALHGHKELRNVAVTGLGAGSLACFRRPPETWTFFEIDPLVEKLARDTKYFHFLSECAPTSRVVLGDARLSLKHIPNGTYDLIIMDAFSSDAIPVHLLTREALAIYTSKLADGGIILFHISNRHLALAPVLADLVTDAGWVAKREQYMPPSMELAATLAQTPAEWVAIARRTEDLAFLGNPRWQPLVGGDTSNLWTDDYSNLFSVLKLQ